MPKPIGYYIPADSELLGDMQKSWGSNFEELTQSEKLWMLATVTGAITAEQTENYDPSDVGDRIALACERLDELGFSNQLGFAQFLIDNLK